MPLILVTNDDGISSCGIEALASALKQIGDVYIVAPETEQSAVAHSLTLHRPLRCEKLREQTYCVNGTPTDCIVLAVNKLLRRKPDVIVSGINDGGNLGDNITYSGTVAAAMEGTLLGVPSIAVSLVDDDNTVDRLTSTEKFGAAAVHAVNVTGKVLEKGIPRDTLLNINIPHGSEIQGWKITKQGKLMYDNAIQDIHDPRGRRHFWIGGGIPQWESDVNTDLDAVKSGYISITPVHLDLTNYDALHYLNQHWKFG